MFEEFKKRWQALMFLVGVATVLVLSWQWVDKRLAILEGTPTKISKIEHSIQELEKRIYYECQQVGEYHYKDIESLLKMTEQRTKELRLLRQNYFTMDKDSIDEPVFVALSEMENSWLSIEKFLRTEQKWYNSVIVKCAQTLSSANSPGVQ